MPTRDEGFPSFETFRRSLRTQSHDAYRGKAHFKVRGPDEFEAQRRHLLDLYGEVEGRHSFVDAAGQVFDCIPIEQQPALRRSGRPLATPPDLPSMARAAPEARVPPAPALAGQPDRFGNAMACPPGTVAVRRVTLEELARFESLEHFLRKGPRASRRRQSQLRIPAEAGAAGAPHEYAHAYQFVPNRGGHAILNVWGPAVPANESFSLAQLWFVANGPAGLQTVEAGWQVFPQKYGHGHPVLFCYWTGDGYRQTGSYNGDGSDFVRCGPGCPIGLALPETSVSGGVQAELELAFMLADGNWWLFAGAAGEAKAVGYYPASQYAGGPMEVAAAEVDFGGETVAWNVYPPMGSGAFAAAGFAHAAYQRDLYFFPLAGGAQSVALQPSQDWPASYTISLGSSPAWGTHFHFGGPGGPGTAPRVASPGEDAAASPAVAVRRLLDALAPAGDAAGASRLAAFPGGLTEVEVSDLGEGRMTIRLSGKA
jgi:hypothetical protein